MARIPSPSPARSHFEAMQRLLRLATVALVLFCAFQAGRLIDAPIVDSVRSIGFSLDLSRSPYRDLLDRSVVPAAGVHTSAP